MMDRCPQYKGAKSSDNGTAALQKTKPAFLGIKLSVLRDGWVAFRIETAVPE